MKPVVWRSIQILILTFFYGALVQAKIAPQVPSTIFLKPSDVTDFVFTITIPGTYIFTDDIYFTKIGSTAITVSVDDVVIDLDGRTLRANNQAGENIGINIVRAPNNQFGAVRKNITIRNGFIANFNVYSVRMDLGSSHITLENLTILSSDIRGKTSLTPTGILLDGLLPAGVPISVRTSDILIKNCFVDNARFGFRARNADNVRVIDSTFNHNGSRGISAIDCNAWELTGCQASQQQIADELGNFGLLLQGGDAWRIKNCDFSFNNLTSPVSSLLPSVGGAQLQAAIDLNFVTVKESGGHVIEGCTFNNNTTTIPGVLVRGLELAFTTSSVVRNCIANGNASVDTGQVGFFDAFGSMNLYENCMAAGNYGKLDTPVGAVGFDAFSTEGACFRNCIALNNIELGLGFGTGFFVDDGSSHCLVQNCTSFSNSAEGFANASGTSVFVGNLAFANPFNYAFAPLGFITVLNGTQPPAGTFDERQIDNISIV
jgi:hypothetical protein